MKKTSGMLMMFLMLTGCASSPVIQNPLPPSLSATTSISIPASTLVDENTPVPDMPATPPVASLEANGTETAASFTGEDCGPSDPAECMSPDGEWLASVFNGFEVASATIARPDGRKSWELSFDQITGAPHCISYANQYGEQACFYGLLFVDHWYKRGRYIFITADYSIDRASRFSYGLYRVDAETGQSSPYLPVNCG